MKLKSDFIRTLFMIVFLSGAFLIQARPVRVLVVTGGHDYQQEPFDKMLTALGKEFTCKIISFPEAFTMFSPENREQSDVIVFYHMWQKITSDEAKNLADRVREGKPLVVLHHSICAFDDWPEYVRITGGKYFHKPTVINGKEYPASSYKHDLKFMLHVIDPKHPVTKGLHDFEVADETYLGYYVDPDVTPLLTTEEPSSTRITGWAHKYGKAQVVTIQSGHDSLTFANPNFRRLLKQSIEWVVKQSKK